MQGSRSTWSVLYGLLLGLASPGMLAVFWVKRAFSLQLDGPQTWTAAVLTSIVLFGSSAAAARSAIGGLGRYALLCLAAIGLLAISHYGFAASWPSQLWQQYFS
jgi:hypothetical protein